MNKNLYSMTGYGRQEETIGESIFTVEIRCLNSKGLDLNVRTPYFLRDKEMSIRTLTAEKLLRGKIEVFIHAESLTTQRELPINWSLLKTYTDSLKEFAQAESLSTQDILGIALKLPDVQKAEDKTFAEAQWETLLRTIELTIQAVQTYRKTEGDSLFQEFHDRIQLILEARENIVQPLLERNEKVRARLKNALDEVLPADKIDANRYEQEIIYYLEKLDISEEQSRLLTNCQHFLEELNHEAQGKKLGFIAQEIGREINTIGSKANDATIQKWVVNMKDELEKIKEQINNVL
jgi:uncharacterized protein (TIGR00255 family)